MWDKTVKSINNFVEYITSIIFVLMVALIFLQIVSRILFGTSFSWTEELARFLMIWLTFLGSSLAFHYGQHISIEFFLSKTKVNYAKWIQIFVSLICIAFFMILIGTGLEIIEKSSMQKSAVLRITFSYVYYIMPISAVLMIINVIAISMKTFRGSEVKEVR